MALIVGTEQNDFLFSADDNDTLLGLGGDDFLSAAGSNVTLDGGDGDDTLNAFGGAAALLGGAGNDSMAGSQAGDTLHGGIGDDLIAGRGGADVLTGGAGNDAFSWSIGSGEDSTSTARDVVSDFEGAGAAGGDTLQLAASFSDPNRLVFQGAANAGLALGAAVGFGGNGFTEVFRFFSGADTMVFADSNDNGVFDATDFVVRIAGQHNLVRSDFGTTNFVIRGSNGNDNITGGVENDTIFALGGNDTVSGGAGNDIINGGDGNDVLNGNAGTDRISGGGGADILNGGDGRDLLTGDDGNDILRGGAGDDTTMAGGNGNDLVFGEEGDDTLDGDAGNDVLSGGVGDDVLFGGDGNDALSGEAGDDELFGDAGNDILLGGGGNDEIEGDAGADLLTGGSGNDEFVFFTGDFNPSSTLAANDTVLDFTGAGVAGGDELAVRSQFLFRGEIAINPIAGATIGGANNGVTEMAYTIRGNNTWLLADDNDNGVLDNSDFAAQFSGRLRFNEADFTRTTFVIGGTEGNNTLVGTAEDDIMYGLGGNDTMSGLEGSDEMHGGLGNDVLNGGPGAGFDALFGDAGNDTLSLQTSEFGGTAEGGDGADLLIGSDADFSFSQLAGGAGNDTLRNGTAGSFMSGEAGTDMFVFGTVWGAAGIQDFTDGTERMDLRTSGLTFADLTIADAFGSTEISSSAGTILLSDVQAANIDAGDFLFS